MLVTIATNFHPLSEAEGSLAIDDLAVTFTPFQASLSELVIVAIGFERQLVERLPPNPRDTAALKYIGAPVVEAHTRPGALWCHDMHGNEFGFYIAGTEPQESERERPRVSRFLRRLDGTPFGEPQFSHFPGKQPLL